MNRFSLRIVSASYIKSLFVSFFIVHCTYLPAHMKTAGFLHLEQHCKDGAIKKTFEIQHQQRASATKQMSRQSIKRYKKTFYI